MKKTLLVFFSSIFIFLGGCGLQIPETVSIRSNAEYNFTVADVSFDLNEKFSVASLLESIKGEEGSEEPSLFNIYSYNPESKSTTQQFLMQMDFQEIPLDFSSYLENTDFTSSLESMSIDKEIEVPSVNFQETKEIDIEVNEKINSLVTFNGYTSNYTGLNISFEDLENGFDSISYKSGYMVVSSLDLSNIELPDIPGVSDLDIPVGGKKITGSVKFFIDDKLITEANFDSNGLAYLPLTDIELKLSGMALCFDTNEEIPFIATVTKNSVVKSVKNLSIKDPFTSNLEVSIPLANDSSLLSCEIEEGNLAVELSLPEQWINASVDYEINFSEGLEATVYPSEQNVNLEGVVFENKDIKADVNVTVDLKNATLTFIDEEGKNLNPFVTVNAEISKIKSAVVKLEEDYNATIEHKEVLPKEALDILNGITWKESGIVIEYTNTLPEGNDLEISMTSDFFGIDKNQAFENTNADEKKTISYLCADNYSVEFGTGENQFSEIDITGEIKFPNYNPETKTLVIKNVVPGEKYSLGIKIIPQIEWDKIRLDSSLANQQGIVNTGLNLSSVFSGMEDSIGTDFVKNIKFKNIPLYLFCDIPEIDKTFDNPKFIGTIKAYFGDEADNNINPEKVFYLLGNETESGELKNQSIPELTFNKDNEVISNLKAEVKAAGGNEEGISLTELFNSMGETGALCMEYNVSFQTGKSDSIEISSEALEGLKKTGETKIKLSGIVLLSLEFEVEKSIKMDVMSFIGKDTSDENFDLLGRTEKQDVEDLKESLDIIESVTINYTSSTIPFTFDPKTPKDDIRLLIDLDGEKTNFDEDILLLKGGKLKKKPSEILDLYPLNPTLKLEIPAGDLVIPREMKFATKIDLSILTNGKITLFDKNKSNGGNK